MKLESDVDTEYFFRGPDGEIKRFFVARGQALVIPDVNEIIAEYPATETIDEELN